MDAGGSAIVLVEAIEASVNDVDQVPLVYHNRTWHQLGEHSRVG
jgi:hypothetical protein